MELILAGVIILQIVDTVVLVYIATKLSGFEKRLEALEEWKADLGRRS